MRRLNLVIYLAVAGLSAIALTGCASAAVPTATALPVATESPVSEPTEPPTAEPTTVRESIVLIDGLGREVTLAAPPQRIVSLAASNTEILFAVGGGDLLVGREDTSDYPPEALQIPSIGSLFGDINTEAIVALEPDLALAAGTISSEQVQAIEQVGIPVFYLANPMSFEELYRNLEIVGELTGTQTQADALAISLRQRVDVLLQGLEGAERVRVYYEVDGTDPNSPWTTGSGTFQDLIIRMAGGENVAQDIQGWGQINLEELVVRDPQAIIFAEAPWIPTTAESLEQRVGWSSISAIADSAVLGIDTNWLDRPGPRLVDAFEAIARFLHPERLD